MPRIVRFAYQRDSVEKDVVGEVTLPQFSAAAVPQVLLQLLFKKGDFLLMFV